MKIIERFKFIYLVGKAYMQILTLGPRAIVQASRLLRVDNSYILTKGWLGSAMLGTPISPKGENLPWINYPMIDLLEAKLKSNFLVLEYGGGNSTIFFQKRVGKVYTVEDNKQWFHYMAERIKSDNVNIIFANDKEEYIQSMKNVITDAELIVVDGLYRGEILTYLANENLSKKTVILPDDTERSEYNGAKDLMNGKGYKELRLSGMKPCLVEESCSSLFYIEGNCFGL